MPIDLEAIKARTDAATAGPWRQTDEHGVIDAGAFPAIVADCGFAENAADAAFIAHARADVPALVAEVERLRVALEEIRDRARFEDWQQQASLRGQLLDIARKADEALDGGDEAHEREPGDTVSCPDCGNFSDVRPMTEYDEFGMREYRCGQCGEYFVDGGDE